MTSDDCQTYQYNLACQSGKKDSNDRIPSVPVKYWDAQHRFALLLVVCGQHMLAFPACPLLEETLLRTTVNGFRRGFRSGTLAEDAFAWELPSADVPDVLRIWALMSSMMDGGAARSYEDLKLLCGAAESTDLYKMPRNRRGAKWEKVEPTAAAAAAAVAADAGAGSGAASRVSRRKRSSPRHSPL
jgi:hypothetical protein